MELYFTVSKHYLWMSSFVFALSRSKNVYHSSQIMIIQNFFSLIYMGVFSWNTHMYITKWTRCLMLDVHDTTPMIYCKWKKRRVRKERSSCWTRKCWMYRMLKNKSHQCPLLILLLTSTLFLFIHENILKSLRI